MKRLIKRILRILIILVGIFALYQVNKTFNLVQGLNFEQREEKTADYDIQKNNLEKEAYKDTKAQWLLDNFDSLNKIEQSLIGNDSDTIEFIYNYENNINDFPYEEGVSKDYGRLTPYYTQWDQRWAYRPLGDSNIGFSGCGPTSMAMVLSRLENDPGITPLTIAEDAQTYMGADGISWKFFTDEAFKYGRSIDNIPLDEDYMINALEKGPLIVSVGPGYFTLSGHILVIDSYDGGKFILNDPNSLKNSEKTWTFSQLADQIANIWLIY